MASIPSPLLPPPRSPFLIKENPVVAHPDEPLRVIVSQPHGRDRPDRFLFRPSPDQRRLLGLVSLRDLLQGRERNWAEERERARALRIRLFSSREPEQPEVMHAR